MTDSQADRFALHNSRQSLRPLKQIDDFTQLTLAAMLAEQGMRNVP
ncbi:hypothetical protein HUU40_18965 [candidate division KSB1 bacterium]|nr:hypothetical protein [candidate division KSB1 bacterium]